MAITERRSAPAGIESLRASPLVGQRMTVEEFLALPEEKPYLELIEGVVRQKVSPTWDHGLLQFGFGRRIDDFAQQHGLGVVVPENRFAQANWVPVPDLSFYGWDRVPLLPDGTVRQDDWVPPDLAVEILSPGQSLKRLTQKCAWFVEHGVRVTLLVHPRKRTVLILRAGAEVQTLTGAAQIDLDDVLPGFTMTVDELFSLLILRRPAEGDRGAE